MDTSNSSDDSSSDYSTESSDDDGMETAQIDGVRLQLPQGLCEKPEIFKELFSADLWNNMSEMHKRHLQTFLPNFPENDDVEKGRTLQRLFDFETFRFSSPLGKFHEDLKAGYFRPDIARMRQIITKAQRKEAKYRYKSYKEVLKQEVIESQKKLLNQIRNLPPGVEPRQEKRKSSVEYLPHRTKRRYFQTLAQIRGKVEDDGCSSDENYPEGPPAPLSRKQKRHLNGIKKDKMFLSTMSMKLNADLERYITPQHNPFYVNDDAYKSMIARHKRQKQENFDDPELNTKGITLSDIVNRTQLPYIKNVSPPSKHHQQQNNHQTNDKSNRKRLKKEVKPVPVKVENSSESEPDIIKVEKIKPVKSKVPKVEIKKEAAPPIPIPPPPPPQPIVQQQQIVNQPAIQQINQINSLSQYGKITPVKVEDLEGIDMMNIPIDLDNSDIDILSEFTVKSELMQNTHANFFALIRDVICSTTEHRMNMYALQERLKSWQENPISPLNDWYSMADNWLNLLPSAITFLCGNSSEQPDDFVPYMEYKTQVDMYQWIGAGRDSDSLLSCLCQFWLEHRTETKTVSPFNNKEKDEIDIEFTERSGSPPPPRHPTNWTVRKASIEEVKDFREQERKRYENPHKAFTYRCNGYESIVGPLKGIYNPAMGNAKARGHTMLSADRPNFVTILSLVRDATARLPNGEGTRADICELLKCSQYIAPQAVDTLLQSVVSGALDRMHTQFDPCVKYDPKRKIWIYLHRNRSEEDFERIHQQCQGVNKKRPQTKKSPKPKKVEKQIRPAKEQPLQQQAEVAKAVANVVATTTAVTAATTTSKVVRKAPAAPPKLISTIGQKSTSLLLANNTKVDPTQQQQLQQQQQAQVQALVQARTASPKSVVKILSPSQGKSLIIPSTTPSKQQVSQQIITQQLLQTLTQQKPIIVKQAGQDAKTVQQHIIQSITPQQLQSIKNVTLLRTNQSTLAPITTTTITSQNNENIVTVSVSKQANQSMPGIQIKTHGNLTQSQQQQILQTIRHRLLPQQQQQQPSAAAAVYKQKNLKAQTANQAQMKAEKAPVVAKVLTNAAGQVISVESLLAHQKQHGQIPQVRVLTSSAKPNNIAQYALTTTTTQARTVTSSKPQTVTKFAPKVTQQLINAKILDGQKLVQPKILMQQQQQLKLGKSVPLTNKPVTLNVANPNTIRMVNAANLNLTHIGGKPILLASKQNLQQNVILQTQGTTTTIGQQQANFVLGPQVKLQQQQQVVLSTGQVKTTQQQQQQIVTNLQPVRLQTSSANTQRLVLASSQGQGGQIVQQILLPAGFQGTAINLKALQGVKVIPIAQTQGNKGIQGRQVFARVMNPSLVKAQPTQPDKPATPTTTSE